MYLRRSVLVFPVLMLSCVVDFEVPLFGSFLVASGPRDALMRQYVQ